MRSATCTLAISCLVVAAAACGGSDGSGNGAPPAAPATGEVTDTPATTASSSGGVRGAIEVMAAAPGQADDAACAADRQTLTTAAEVFLVTHGSLPTSQQELVDAKVLTELSPRFEITSAGEIVPAPGSACT